MVTGRRAHPSILRKMAAELVALSPYVIIRRAPMKCF
jgi:hypothetical protein